MHQTILVIEGIPDMAQYIKDLLAEEGYLVYTCTTGAEGLKLTKSIQPGLILLGIELPDIDSRALCKQLKREYPEIKIIIVSGEDTPESIADGLNIGADDYITKPIAPVVLLARVRARIRSTGNNDTLKIGTVSLNRKTHGILNNNEELKLSAQEYKLLEYFMENPNKVLTREMILSRIWKNNPDIQTRVVDVYVGYLRKKLNNSKKKIIHSVRGFGYMFSGKKPQ